MPSADSGAPSVASGGRSVQVLDQGYLERFYQGPPPSGGPAWHELYLECADDARLTPFQTRSADIRVLAGQTALFYSARPLQTPPYPTLTLQPIIGSVAARADMQRHATQTPPCLPATLRCPTAGAAGVRSSGSLCYSEADTVRSTAAAPVLYLLVG